MKNVVDVSSSKKILLPSLTWEEIRQINSATKGWEKGWSFSYVYSLYDLRNVYLAICKRSSQSLSEFYKFCLSINLPHEGAVWSERRLLENINALINFDLINSDWSVKESVFQNSTIIDELSDADLNVFYQKYFSYIRFKEVFSWFLDPVPREKANFVMGLSEQDILHNSRAIFSFSSKPVNSKGTVRSDTNSFFYKIEDNPTLYCLDKKNGDLMRFWDVFCTWGMQLGVVDKFTVPKRKITPDSTISCTYVINRAPILIDLIEYIEQKELGSYIYLPELVMAIALEYRQSIEAIHSFIIEQHKNNKENFSFERTSGIFVQKSYSKQNRTILFPKYNDAYVSHLIVR